jgi:hypothetical protein
MVLNPGSQPGSQLGFQSLWGNDCQEKIFHEYAAWPVTFRNATRHATNNAQLITNVTRTW